MRILCGSRRGVRGRRARVVRNSTSPHETSHMSHWSALCCGAKVALYDRKAPQGGLDLGMGRLECDGSLTFSASPCRLSHRRGLSVPSPPWTCRPCAVHPHRRDIPCRLSHGCGISVPSLCSVSPSVPSLRRPPPQNPASRAFRRRPQPARVASETPGTHHPRSVGPEAFPSQSIWPEAFPSKSLGPEAFPSQPTRPNPSRLRTAPPRTLPPGPAQRRSNPSSITRAAIWRGRSRPASPRTSSFAARASRRRWAVRSETCSSAAISARVAGRPAKAPSLR